MCDQSNDTTLCGFDMDGINRAVLAGDAYIAPFCIHEITTILIELRYMKIHPGNIDTHLERTGRGSVTYIASRAGNLSTAILAAPEPTQTYLATQYKSLIQTLAEFAYVFGAIKRSAGEYFWDESALPPWQDRANSVKQWLAAQGCPIGDHHMVQPVHWIMTYMQPGPNGTKRRPQNEPEPVPSQAIGLVAHRRLQENFDWMKQSIKENDKEKIRRSLRAFQRILDGEASWSL